MSIKTYKVKSVGKKMVTDHFAYSEFACPESDSLKLDELLPLYLEAIMQRVGAKRAVITSGYRTPDYSVKVGGSRTDKHTTGMAADVVFYDANGKVISPIKISCAAEELGFIGGIARIGRTATHLDTRSLDAPYWGDESTGSTRSIWYQKSGCNSFYAYYKVAKPKEMLVSYKTKKAAPYRAAPFKKAERVGTLKKGTAVQVVKNGKIVYGGRTFYKCKLGKNYYWVNRKYLKRA